MTQPRPGRPRHQDYDRRILEGAVKTFSMRGWSGFTFEAVAAAAGVGKPALYLRWNSRITLLQAALTELVAQPDEDFGSLRRDTEAYVRRMFDFMLSDSGRAWVRLLVEAPFHDELSVFTRDSLLGPADATFKGIATRAVERGEISQTPPIRFLLEVVGGPIVMRVLNTPIEQQDAVAAQADSYVARLTDFILAGLLSATPTKPTRRAG